MQTKILVLAALILVAIPIVGCAEIISTPNVRITWTPTGDSAGEEFPPTAVVTQTVEYEIDDAGTWYVLPGADSVTYDGAGVENEVRWTLPDFSAYRFKAVLRVLYEGIEFVRYCETEAVRYFGIGPIECDAEADQ